MTNQWGMIRHGTCNCAHPEIGRWVCYSNTSPNGIESLYGIESFWSLETEDGHCHEHLSTDIAFSIPLTSHLGE